MNIFIKFLLLLSTLKIGITSLKLSGFIFLLFSQHVKSTTSCMKINVLMTVPRGTFQTSSRMSVRRVTVIVQNVTDLMKMTAPPVAIMDMYVTTESVCSAVRQKRIWTEQSVEVRYIFSFILNWQGDDACNFLHCSSKLLLFLYIFL